MVRLACAHRARIAALAAAIACASCGRDAEPAPATQSAAKPLASPPAAAVAPDKTRAERLAPRAERAHNAKRLPEDAAAGKRASEQWDEHLAEEERERKLVFDREHMRGHRAIIARIVAARGRYDRARTEAQLKAARTAVGAQLTSIQAEVAKLDPHGQSSGLLADYAELQAALSSTYPDAKAASLRNEAAALRAEQARFDERLEAMTEWLEKAEHAKGEGEEDEDGEHEEHEREELEARVR